MSETKAAHTVTTFCQAFKISRSFFYKLQREGKAPRLMKVGRRTLISAEATQEWQDKMETPA